MIKLGWYHCPGTLPICVVDKGTPADSDLHGPWIKYHLHGEAPEAAITVLFTAFKALQDLGYRHESERQ